MRYLLLIIANIFLVSFFISPVQAADFSVGDLIKASGPAVYYYSSDNKRYVFPNETTYKTWYSDFSSVKTITDEELAVIPLGDNITIRPGTKLVKITTDPKVYAVESGGALRWVETETIATGLYGANWARKVIDVPDVFFTNYQISESIKELIHPEGTLIQYPGSINIYYIDCIDGEYYKRRITNDDAKVQNHFYDENILAIPFNIYYPNASDIISFESNLVNPLGEELAEKESAEEGSPEGTITSSAIKLNDSIVFSRNVMRGLQDVSIAAFNFTAGSESNIRLKKIKLTFYVDQNGGDGSFSQGSDEDSGAAVYASNIVSNVGIYDYENNNLLGKIYDIEDDGIVEFSFLNWEIPAGNTKTLVIKADISNVGSYNCLDRFAVDIADISKDVSVIDNDENVMLIQNGGINGGANPKVIMKITEQGKLTIKNSSSQSNSVIITPGENKKVNSFELESVNEPFVVKRISFSNDNWEENSGLIYDTKISYKNNKNETVEKVGKIGIYNLDFSDLDLYVPADSKTTFDIFVSIKSFRNSFDSGKKIKISFPKTNRFVAKAEYTGKEFEEKDFFGGNLIYSISSIPSFVLRNGYPEFGLNSLSPSGLIERNRKSEILRFNISNPTLKDIEIDKLTFKIYSTDVGHSERDLLEYLADVNGDFYDDDDIVNLYFVDRSSSYLAEGDSGIISFSIYDYSSGVLDTSPSDFITDNNDYGIIQFKFYGDDMIFSAGESKVLVLELHTSYMASGSRYLDVELLGDNEGDSISSSNINWNDGFRDINGYLISGVPVEGHRLKFD